MAFRVGLEPTPIGLTGHRSYQLSYRNIKASTFPCWQIGAHPTGKYEPACGFYGLRGVRAEVARAAKEGLPLYTQTKSGLSRPMRQVFAVTGHGIVEPPLDSNPLAIFQSRCAPYCAQAA